MNTVAFFMIYYLLEEFFLFLFEMTSKMKRANVDIPK